MVLLIIVFFNIIIKHSIKIYSIYYSNRSTFYIILNILRMV